MNRFVKIVLAIVILIAVPKIIMKVMTKGPTEKLAEFVKETNARLPIMIDPNTRLTRVDFSNNVYKVNYVLLAQQADFTDQQIKSIERYAISQVCAGDMKIFAKEKVTVEFVYEYRNADGPQTMITSVPPHKCV